MGDQSSIYISWRQTVDEVLHIQAGVICITMQQQIIYHLNCIDTQNRRDQVMTFAIIINGTGYWQWGLDVKLLCQQ